MKSLMKYFRLLISYISLIFKSYGLNFKLLYRGLKCTPRFVSDYRSYSKKISSNEGEEANDVSSFELRKRHLVPCLFDYEENAGGFGSYFFQDLWAARKIYQFEPTAHLDVGSRIDGFIGHLLVFRNVSVVDVRPLDSNLEGLDFVQSDATKMELFDDESVQSISSLHAAEHFGLGRYGDPIDPNACFSFMKSLQRVLAKDGKLLFSVPIGMEKLYFNANRIFSPSTFIKSFDQLSLTSFSVVSSKQGIIENISIDDFDLNDHKVGLFEFTRSSS